MDVLHTSPTQTAPVLTWSERQSQRGDSEHEQVLVRLLLSCGVVVYFYFVDVAAIIFWVAHVYFVTSILLTLLVYHAQQASPARRICALFIDVTAVTIGMAFSSQYTAPFYGGYLWLSLAYGIRYGHRYTILGTGLSVIGFSYALLVSDYWHENLYLGLGLWLWLVLIPIYIVNIVKRLEQALAEAKKANASKSQFVSGVSHELRTPLNAILGYSELLKEDADGRQDRQSVEDLDRIKRAAHHLLTLVNDLLDIEKIEAGKMQIHHETVDLISLLDEACLAVQPQLDKRHNRLEIGVQNNIDTIVSDYMKLKQILINLLSNAAKFTENGEVDLWMTNINKNSGAWLKIVIKDSGVGMSAEEMNHLFQPYTQVGVSSQHNDKGSGLGLSLCKKFTELLGGSIELYSEPGRGTTFIVLLPYDTAHNQQLSQ